MENLLFSLSFHLRFFVYEELDDSGFDMFGAVSKLMGGGF